MKEAARWTVAISCKITQLYFDLEVVCALLYLVGSALRLGAFIVVKMRPYLHSDIEPGKMKL